MMICFQLFLPEAGTSWVPSSISSTSDVSIFFSFILIGVSVSVTLFLRDTQITRLHPKHVLMCEYVSRVCVNVNIALPLARQYDP